MRRAGRRPASAARLTLLNGWRVPRQTPSPAKQVPLPCRHPLHGAPTSNADLMRTAPAILGAGTADGGLAIGGGSAPGYCSSTGRRRPPRRACCPTAPGPATSCICPAAALRCSWGKQCVSARLVGGRHALADRRLVRQLGEGFVWLPPSRATVRPPPQGAGRRDVVVQLTATVTGQHPRMHCVQRPTTSPALAAGLPATRRRRQPEPPASARHPRLPTALAEIERVFGRSSQAGGSPAGVPGLRARLERLLGPPGRLGSAAAARPLHCSPDGRAGRRCHPPNTSGPGSATIRLHPTPGPRRRPRRVAHRAAHPGLFGQGIGSPPAGRAQLVRMGGRCSATAPPAVCRAAPSCGDLGCWPATWKRCPTASGPGRRCTTLYDDSRCPRRILEQVPALHRIEVGKWLLERLAPPKDAPGGRWAASAPAGAVRQRPRGGAGRDRRGRWLEAVLALDWKRVRPAAFAAADRPPHRRPQPRPADALRDTVVRRPPQARRPRAGSPWCGTVAAWATPTSAAASAKRCRPGCG